LKAAYGGSLLIGMKLHMVEEEGYATELHRGSAKAGNYSRIEQRKEVLPC
jgi:hypothetical protein